MPEGTAGRLLQPISPVATEDISVAPRTPGSGRRDLTSRRLPEELGASWLAPRTARVPGGGGRQDSALRRRQEDGVQQRQTGEASREEGRLLQRGVEENPEQPEQQVRG